MSSVNGFLKDFIQMRKGLVPSGTAGDVRLVDPGPSGKKGKKAPPTRPTELKDDGKMTVAKIIEEKPKVREVIQYLQDRCNDFTMQKMA